MARIRPTMADYKLARDFEWYEQHSEWIEQQIDGRWIVFATDDAYDHDIHSIVESLGEAIGLARELVGEADGPQG